MELSAAGLTGAFVGLIAGWASYVIVVGSLEPRLRKLDKSTSPAERTAFEDKLRAMRRLILAIETVAFSIAGYAAGHWIAG